MSKKSLVALAHGLDVQENVTRVFDMMVHPPRDRPRRHP